MTTDEVVFASPESVRERLRLAGYIADVGLSTAIFLSHRMTVPLLLEGEPGVGKTDLAYRIAALSGRTVLRLQCYEGIDASHALYEWNYSKQLLAARAIAESATDGNHSVPTNLYTEEFLLTRPVLSALKMGDRAILLIDEVDRADDQFDAFLLEVLSGFTVTIPELGTIKAISPPLVFLTSNRTRELHDALKRRCLYHWIDLPQQAVEAEIVRVHVPELDVKVVDIVTRAVHLIRRMQLHKPPGTAESIGWARAIASLGQDIDLANANRTLGAVVKVREDTELVRHQLKAILDESLAANAVP